MEKLLFEFQGVAVVQGAIVDLIDQDPLGGYYPHKQQLSLFSGYPPPRDALYGYIRVLPSRRAR